jgi:hypothetical protein
MVCWKTQEGATRCLLDSNESHLHYIVILNTLGLLFLFVLNTQQNQFPQNVSTFKFNYFSAQAAKELRVTKSTSPHPFQSHLACQRPKFKIASKVI